MQYIGLIFFTFMIIIGCFSVNFRFVSLKFVSVIPILLMNVFYPAMIISSFLQIDVASLSGSGLPVFVATIALTLLLYWLSAILLKKESQSRLILMQPSLCSLCFLARLPP